MSANQYDIAIIGSGYAASLLAMIARRLNRRVVLLEKSRHPRFAIGESSTPLANLWLEELALRYDLPRVLPLAKWGSWQKNYPGIGCGLKRGFSFYHHQFNQEFQSLDTRENELLVAASPRDEIADTHWFRADFDDFLLREAQSFGVDYHDETTLNAPQRDGESGWILSGNRQQKNLEIRARLLIDASGPRGYLHRAFGLSGQRTVPTQVLYSHFENVRLFAEIIGADENAPFPLDEAALHHVFDGGWMWVLRFNNGITSAGISVCDALADELNLADDATAWQRILARLPSVAAQFESATPLRPFAHLSAPSFRSETIAGDNWALLPSSAGFSDPLLSTGFPLALSGVACLAEIIENDWEDVGAPLQNYAAQTQRELKAVESLVGALYANMHDFEIFSALTMLYFAAASFSETARRLNKSQLAGAFLLCDHPKFGPQMRACLEAATHLENATGKAALLRQIWETVAPFDVVGIGDKSRRNWYPARAQDLYENAAKLGATHTEIAALLQRCGF